MAVCRRPAVPGVGPLLAGALPADRPGGALEHARRGAGRAALHVLPLRGAPPAAGEQTLPVYRRQKSLALVDSNRLDEVVAEASRVVLPVLQILAVHVQ